MRRTAQPSVLHLLPSCVCARLPHSLRLQCSSLCQFSFRRDTTWDLVGPDCTRNGADGGLWMDGCGFGVLWISAFLPCVLRGDDHQGSARWAGGRGGRVGTAEGEGQFAVLQGMRPVVSVAG